jgi:histidinol-phosphate/aromatic aminotransferase/cobyric acid decarboxylase-like protein
MTLASSSYAAVGTLADGDGVLNLSWALDERDFLAVDLPSVLSRMLTDEVAGGLPWLHSYLVQDPYGDAVLSEPVAELFAMAGRPLAVTSGSGVNSLLHALAQLCREGTVYVIGDVYPDFPHWVAQAGGRCVSRISARTDAGHAANARTLGARAVLVERPGLSPDPELDDLSRLDDLCEQLAGTGTVVIVDESYANYCPPEFSAAGLAVDTENLIVLRGMSKGYGLGGLRVGYCVTAPGTATVVRSVVPPMQASSLSLGIARKVLELGDLTSTLRDQVAIAKAEMLALLDNAGLGDNLTAGAHAPYLFFAPSSPTPELLERRGVAGKMHHFWSESTLGADRLHRLSVPLREVRRNLLRERLTTA